MKNMSGVRRAAMGAGLAALFLSVSASSLMAQTIKVGSKEIQVHGSLQQGFGLTNDNNFLTMDTTGGSIEMTDAAINVSSSPTRNLRVGAQLYVRNIGALGNGALQLDWAFADYKFTNAFGLRGGKIKTVLGLFTDTQDMEFLYTWALLPQGTYPLDLRSITIAHVGGDAYGVVKLGKAGSVAYTAYLGMVQDDDQGGYRYGVQDEGLGFRSGVNSHGGGFDTRWTTPVSGLMTGYSFTQNKTKVDLVVDAFRLDFTAISSPARRQAAYADYQASRLRVSGEWRHELSDTLLVPAVYPRSAVRSQSSFAAASYRLFEKLEVGSYYSHYLYDTTLPSSNIDNHIYDKAVSGRIELNRFWNVKVEGHFIDGNGSPTLARGFYRRDNTSGFNAKTRMLVIRTGVNF
jgi:hypothetical protein